jgi:hypothetical protein
MRSLRILQDGATYHVSSKIDHDMMALHGEEIKQLFLDFVILSGYTAESVQPDRFELCMKNGKTVRGDRCHCA